MEIVKNSGYAKSVLQKLAAVYKAETFVDDGLWHVSDLVFPRKSYACEIYGCESTEEEIGYFFLGKAVHVEIQRILGVENSEVVVQKKLKAGTVIGTLDYLGEEAVEIKSSRKWTVAELPEPHYIRQAGYYAVLRDLPKIHVLVIYPTAGRTWNGEKSSTVEAASWVLKFSDQDKQKIEKEMNDVIKNLEKAIKTKDAELLPPCPPWLLKRFGDKIKSGWDKKAEFKYQQYPFHYINDPRGVIDEAETK